MVMANNNPKTKWVRLIHRPPISIQMIFIMVLRHPGSFGLLTTSLPKGTRASMESFSVCIPNGIPIMVRQRRTLEMTYMIKMINPPKIIRIISPRILINITILET
jgi:hypothetical protein